MHVARKHLLQCGNRTLRAVLLQERKHRVHDHDRGDRDGELRHPGEERQDGAGPQEERERLHEVRRGTAVRLNVSGIVVATGTKGQRAEATVEVASVKKVSR